MEQKTIFKTRDGRDLPISLEVITPEIAKKYLETSPGNRRTKEQTLGAYVRDFEAGNWKLTGSSICFDENGKLMDGHHRLMACVKSGVPFETLVVGLPRETMIAIDRGAQRTIADMFCFAGVEKNQALISATAHKVLLMLDPTAGRQKKKYSAAEMKTEYEMHKDIYEYSINYAKEVFKSYRQLVPSTIASFMAFLVIKGCPKEKVEDFFDQIAHYRSQSKTIETVMTKLAAVTSMKARNVSTMKWIILVRGWNAWMRGNNNLTNISYIYERDKNIQPIV